MGMRNRLIPHGTAPDRGHDPETGCSRSRHGASGAFDQPEARFLSSIPTYFRENVLLRDRTTYRIGGTARYFARVEGPEALAETVSRAGDRNLPWFVIGRGSNLLVSDSGFDGVVIRLAGAFNEFRIDREKGRVIAGGGVSLPRLVAALAAAGYEGLSFLSGIPGTVGGAVRINAGAAGGETADAFVRARIWSGGAERVMESGEMGFSYRNSVLMGGPEVVLSAEFAVQRAERPEAVKKDMKERIRARLRKQPGVRRNCGSVFKTPETGAPAGWYIDQAGLKGARIGDAMVAHEHANWIVNLGHATSADVRRLIDRCRETVLREFKVELHREVLYVPEDVIAFR